MRRVVGRTLYGVGERLMFGYFGCYIYIYMRGRGWGEGKDTIVEKTSSCLVAIVVYIQYCSSCYMYMYQLLEA